MFKPAFKARRYEHGEVPDPIEAGMWSATPSLLEEYPLGHLGTSTPVGGMEDVARTVESRECTCGHPGLSAGYHAAGCPARSG